MIKRFFKYLVVTTFGTFLGLLLFIIFIISILTAISSGIEKKDVQIKPQSVLLINLNEPIEEISDTNPLESVPLIGSQTSALGLYDILQSIRFASSDPNIQGIVLHATIAQAGYSSLFEIREALAEFKESGKFVYAYSDIYSQKTYTLASIADKIFISPEGMFELTGISSQFVSYKQLLDKIGVQALVFRTGNFKSFAEPFIQDSMSRENREQIQNYITDVWEEVYDGITDNRPHISTQLNKIADSLLVWDGESALQYGLVDSLMYYYEFENAVKQQLHIANSKKISYISLKKYIQYSQQQSQQSDDESIALIIGQGGIQAGKGDKSTISSDTFCKHITDATKDSTIRAIVLRINSGGGSALASDNIWYVVKEAAKIKPVVVSMGDMAASGGYYIASPAHTIIANPTTLTGSIGVFGMLLNTEELLHKLGVSIESVSTHTFSDLGSPTRTMTHYEKATIQKHIDKTYNTFKARVAEGRNLKVEDVELIAQGRIWSGKDALDHKLIDDLGGLTHAINIAIRQAKLPKDCNIKTYPQQKSFIEEFSDKFFQSKITLKGIEGLQQIESIVKQAPKEKGIYMQLPYYLSLE